MLARCENPYNHHATVYVFLYLSLFTHTEKKSNHEKELSRNNNPVDRIRKFVSINLFLPCRALVDRANPPARATASHPQGRCNAVEMPRDVKVDAVAAEASFKRYMEPVRSLAPAHSREIPDTWVDRD